MNKTEQYAHIKNFIEKNASGRLEVDLSGIEEEKKLAKKNKRLTITKKILSFSLAVMTVAAIISFATH